MRNRFAIVESVYSHFFQAGRSLSGITAGPLLGIFTMGMFFPMANSMVRRADLACENPVYDKTLLSLFHYQRVWL